MNLLFSCIGRRGYMARYFRPHLATGERIFGTSHTPWTPGLAACDERLILPPIESDEYIPSVVDTCRRREIGALLSFYDPDVNALCEHRDALRSVGCLPILPSPRTIAIAYDKWTTFTELTAMGYAVPMTVESLDHAMQALNDGILRFPLVVKPRRGFGSANTFIARNRLQLEAFCSLEPNMLVQQFIAGQELNTSILSDMQATVLSVVPIRKRLMAGGETQHGETIEHAALLSLASKLANDMRSVGPLDVDFIEAEDGQLYVLDLNPRFGGAYPVAHVAGADFPGLVVDMVRGKPVMPRVGDYRRSVYMLKDVAILGGDIAELTAGSDND
ncbi:MAG: ATP-grasp domain-containing protein [Pseudomonadota bacterium]